MKPLREWPVVAIVAAFGPLGIAAGIGTAELVDPAYRSSGPVFGRVGVPGGLAVEPVDVSPAPLLDLPSPVTVRARPSTTAVPAASAPTAERPAAGRPAAVTPTPAPPVAEPPASAPPAPAPAPVTPAEPAEPAMPAEPPAAEPPAAEPPAAEPPSADPGPAPDPLPIDPAPVAEIGATS